MPAIIRQQYTDSTSAKKIVREINVELEVIRPENNAEVFAQINLKAELWGGPDVSFQPILVDPKEIITELFDARRTTSNCSQTYLVKPYLNGNCIEVHNVGPKGLSAKTGDPIVVMSKQDGTDSQFALISSVSGNKIYFLKETEALDFNYYTGAIVQNLSNRCWHGFSCTGAKTYLSRPRPITFVAKASEGGIKLVISSPMNYGTLRAYDVYVRKHFFESLESHWIPDIFDLDIGSITAFATTYNGGKDAGGGPIEPGNIYYITLISKDGLGRVDVNESECVVTKVVV